MIVLKNVSKLIAQHGGIEKLKEDHIKIHNSVYMPLTIEWIGEIMGKPLISVCHYYEQEGDFMRDPDVVLMVTESAPHIPTRRFSDSNYFYEAVSYRQDGLGVYDEAVFKDGDTWHVKKKMQGSIESFMRVWDKNLGDKGFLGAQTEQARVAIGA